MKSAAEVAPAVLQAWTSRDIHFFIVDAPAEAFKPLAAAVRGRDVLLFNATAPDDALRRDLCAKEIVHIVPSLAMSMDGWCNILCRANGGIFSFCKGRSRPTRDGGQGIRASAQEIRRAHRRQQALQGRHRSARARAEQSRAAQRHQPRLRRRLRRRRCLRFRPQVPYQLVSRGRWSAASISSPWLGIGPGSTTARRR